MKVSRQVLEATGTGFLIVIVRFGHGQNVGGADGAAEMVVRCPKFFTEACDVGELHRLHPMGVYIEELNTVLKGRAKRTRASRVRCFSGHSLL